MDYIPMPQILDSPRAVIGRRGPAQIHRVDWARGAKVPPTYVVSWRHGGQRRDVHEDELVSAYTPAGEVADAVKAYLTRRKFSELRHDNVPQEGVHENYAAYKSHYDLMVDTGRGAIAPRYEPSGNSAAAPGGMVLTAECRARAAYLKNRGAGAPESDSDEEEDEYVARDNAALEELVQDRDELLRGVRERAAQLAAEAEAEAERELSAPPPVNEAEDSTEEEDNEEREEDNTPDTPGTQDAPAEATDQATPTELESEGPSTDEDATDSEEDPPTPRRLRPRDPETGRVARFADEAPQQSTLMFAGAERHSEAGTATGIELPYLFEDDF